MRLKTQILISITAFTVILVIIGSSVVLTQLQITQLNNQEATARDIQTGASNLNYISNNYFLYQSDSSNDLWQSEFSTLSVELAQLNSTNTQQQTLVSTVNDDLVNLNSVFGGVTIFLHNAPRNESIRVLPSFQTQWNRMSVQVQALSFDSQQLSQAIKDQSDQAIFTNSVSTIALMALFVAFFVIIYLLNSRRMLKSISELKTGIGVIGSGNLDHTIEAGNKDEIADISTSINQMASDLKRTTASKNDLEKEIAERQKTEEALRQTSTYLDNLLNYSNAPIIVWNTESKITLFNHAFERLTGLRCAEAVGNQLSILFPENQKEEALKYINRTLEGEFWEEVEIPIQLKNGIIRTLLWNSANIYDEDGERIVATIAQGNDITERKKAEEALIASEQKANDLIKYAPSGIYELDYHFPPKFRSVNDAMCQILGYTRDELFAMSPFALLDDESKTRFRERITKMLAGEKVDETVEFKVIAKNGRSIDAILNTTFTYKDGKPDGALVVAHDVTELKNAERALEKRAENLEILVEERTKQLKDSERLAAIGATAGMVGHDIRNPLQAITSDLYLAKSDLTSIPESEEKKNIKESLEEIEKNIFYVNKIVADLQDFARPLAPKLEEVDLEQTIHSALAHLVIPGNVTVKHSVRKDFPKLRTDQAYMQRILTNLANNAIQAMPNGGKLAINAVTKNGKALITVEDNGEGIPESVRNKLFTPLVTTKSKGQGFGLSVVKRFTEAMGGTVTFESEVGKGTKFTIELPL